MVEIEINYQAGKIVKKKFLEDLANSTFKLLKIKGKQKISLGLVTNAEIKKNNRIYRKKNKVTDVLSFSEKDQKFCFPTEKNYLGEILICYSQAVLQAKKYNKTVKEELSLLFVHGLLHLLGYDHQKQKDHAKMKKLEQDILSK
ncbi:rRNA maturation RNase YbeY [Patescibacteria group bacterium]|nr:rRNA maturation RNase YbeY [Patescibacteria group bacterium]